MVLYPQWLTFGFLCATAILFLVLVFVFGKKQLRDKSISLMFAVAGIGLAFLAFSLGMKEIESSGVYFNKECQAEGYVTGEENGSIDLSLLSLDGKFLQKKIRVDEDQPLTVGKRYRFTFVAEAASRDEFQDGVFLCGKVSEYEETGRSVLISFIHSLRVRFFENLGTSREGGFLKAVLLGDRSGLADEHKAAFRQTASSHLLAISGLHITVLVGLAHCVMEFFYMPQPWEKALLFPLVLLLYLLTGGAVSVFRAGFMAVLSASAYFLKRRGDPVTALTLAASIIVLNNPFAVTDLSFQFSFVSTFAIVTVAAPLCSEVSERILPFFYSPWKKLLYSSVAYVLSSITVGVAATLFTLPISLLAFEEYQLLSPIYSVILIPLFTPCVTAGVILLLLFLFPFQLPFATKAVFFFNRLFLELVAVLNDSSPAPIGFGGYALPIAFFLIAILVIFIAFRRKLRDFLILYSVLAVSMLPLLFLP